MRRCTLNGYIALIRSTSLTRSYVGISLRGICVLSVNKVAETWKVPSEAAKWGDRRSITFGTRNGTPATRSLGCAQHLSPRLCLPDGSLDVGFRSGKVWFPPEFSQSRSQAVNSSSFTLSRLPSRTMRVRHPSDAPGPSRTVRTAQRHSFPRRERSTSHRLTSGRVGTPPAGCSAVLTLATNSASMFPRRLGDSRVPGRNVFPVRRLVSIAARAWLLSVTESFVLPPVTREAPCHKMLSLVPTSLHLNAHHVRSATD